MAGTPAHFSALRASVSGRNVFQGRLRPGHAEVTDVRGPRLQWQPRSGFYRHDARFHGESPGDSRLQRILQEDCRKAHDQKDGPSAEWAPGLVFSGVGPGYPGATLQFQV